MSRALESRPVQVLNVPLPDGTEVLLPDQVILMFPNNMTIDIGALCYLKREDNKRFRPPTEGRLVDLTSKSRRREQHVRQLIALISSNLSHSGARAKTILDRYKEFLNFMRWADTSGFEQILDDKAIAHKSYQAYCAHLRERVSRNEISTNTGATIQQRTLNVIEELLSINNLGRGIYLLRKNSNAGESTKPPSEADQAKVLALCSAIFRGLSNLVVNKEPYPFSMEMPDYLGLPDNRIWIFPTNTWFMSPSMLENRHCRKRPVWCINYIEGRLSTLEEMESISGHSKITSKQKGDARAKAKENLYSTRHQIKLANSNPEHAQRKKMAGQAINMFAILFLSQTGMNWADITNLTWNDDFEVEANHQSFRTIKWRSGGKIVSFELAVAFMPTFRRYLAVRKYLLKGTDFNYLFFRMGNKWDRNPTQLTGAATESTFETLRRFDPELQKVLPRQWRAAKSDWLVRNTDPATAAVVLQNTEKTLLKHYVEGSETVHLEEMTNFLDQVSKTVLDSDVVVAGGVPRAVGVCASFGHPVPTEAVIAVKPDCKGPEGCLFCDKYKVHADEVDTRKLLSCRYCIRATLPMMGSDERVKKFLQPILDRIDGLVDEIRKRSPKMTKRVIDEVENEGELDPYWARKLEMLMELGALG